MRILVLSDCFWPEIAAPSVRVLDHARVWQRLGHEVTVVTCAPNFPRGKVFEGYQNRAYQEEEIEGIRVIRVWSYMAANAGFFKRSLDYASYMLSAVWFSFRYPEFDVILATSPQFFTAVAGYFISLLRRRPWVFEIRDLWPASIRAVGAANGMWIRALEHLELFLYRRADRIISLTDSFKSNLVTRGISAAKIDVVTNGADTTRFHPDQVSLDARASLNLPKSAFLAGYVGTTGMAHGLGTLLEAAALCREEANLRFLIMGDGAERKALEERAQSQDLRNVLFRDPVSHDQMPSVLAALDAVVVHLRPDPLFETVIPSKIFEAMAMGKPIVLGVPGESARVVGNAGCGVCIPSGDHRALAEAVRKLSADPWLCKQMSQAGQEAVRVQYNRRAKAKAALRSLEGAISALPAQGQFNEHRRSTTAGQKREPR